MSFSVAEVLFSSQKVEKENDMKGFPLKIVFVGLALSIAALSTVPANAEELVIGGSSPSERPAEAPTIPQTSKDATLLARGLFGISKPYPPSLLFLKDQGGWYSPFLHPGMHRPYDLRGWHDSTNTETNLNKEESPKRDRN